MNNSVLPLLLAIVAVGVLVFAAILFSQKRGHRFDRERYQSDWLKLENQLQKSNAATYPLAIINADKLLDRALRELCPSGQTMGERLKKLGGRLSDLNAVWSAHKLRNRIAHEPDCRVSYDQARRALVAFKRALKDLDAI